MVVYTGYACQRGSCTHVQDMCQFLIFTWQCANAVPIIQLFLPKGVPIFQEYLGISRKLILRNKEFKFWHLQNFIKEKPCQPKTYDLFSMERVVLTKQLFG